MKQILLAAAHLEHAPLPALVSEIRVIEKLLMPLHQQKNLDIQSNRAANIDDLFDHFSQYPSTEIFHYAGHADGSNLYLEEAGNIKGIAELFGLNRVSATGWNTLRLVFLNGCASKGQVSSLHKAGVQAIIATSRPIDDQLGALFARNFYQSWNEENCTFLKAFETACARVHTQSADTEIVTEQRNLAFQDKADYVEPLPWGLYLHPALEDPDQVHNWVLHEIPRLPDMLLAEVKSNATQSLSELVREFIKQEKQRSFSRKRRDPVLMLIERLPWTIGTHLRRLFAAGSNRTMLEPGLERLKELIAAYSDLTQFLSYLSLAILWDSRRKQLELQPNAHFEALPFSLIPETDHYEATDYIYRTSIYLERIHQLSDAIVDPIQILPHIEAVIQKVEDEKVLASAYNIMEGWKQAMATGEEQLAALIAARSEGKNRRLKTISA